MKTEEQKSLEVQYSLLGIQTESLADFIKEQEGYLDVSSPYLGRDKHIHDTILELFHKSGMTEEDLLCWISEGERPPLDGFAACYIDEGLQLFKNKELFGTVTWCYRGSMGSCDLDLE